MIHNTFSFKKSITFFCFIVSTPIYAQVFAPAGAAAASSYLWLKANVGVTGTAQVTAWNDQSNNNRHMSAIAATSPSITSVGLNFNPVISFDGINDFMTRAAGILGASTQSDFYVYAVVRSKSVASQMSLFFESTSNAGTPGIGSNIPLLGGNVNYDLGNTTTGRISTLWGGNTSEYFLWSFQSSTGTATPTGTNKAIFRNGQQLVTNNNSLSAVGNNSPLFLGSTNGTTNFLNGDIAEIFIKNGVPSLGEHYRIQSYFALKYGITLSDYIASEYRASNGSRMWRATTAGIYTNDIAGIGRDDQSDLNQKQSRSINTDDIVTIGLGTIASSNTLNTNTFSTNRTFLTWANNNDNNGIIEETNSELAAKVTSRLDREWKVQEENGDVGNTTVQIDMSSVSLSTSNASGLYLMIDSDLDGDFTTGSIRYIQASSFNSNILTFNNVNFNHLEVFTIGIYGGCSPGGITNYPTAWYKANGDLTTLASNVTTWNSETLGPNLTQVSSDPSLVSNTTDFQPSVFFDGNDFVYQTVVDAAGVLDVSDNTMISVFNIQSGVVLSKIEYDGYRMGMEASSSNLRFDYPSSGSQNIGTTNIMNNYVIGTGVTNSTVDTTFINGRIETTNAGGSVGFPGSANLSIGAEVTSLGFYPSVSNINELMYFRKHLTATERTRAESYLAVKYGITLGTTASPVTYLSAASTSIWAGSNVYQNDIAGMGQDDNSCLYKTKSRGINSDAIVLMESPSNLGNGEFLLWGNDNAALTEQLTEVPKEVYKRLTREWRTDMTGDVGTVTVKINIAGLGLSTNVNDFTLMVDSDNDFSNCNVINANRSRVGDTIIFQNVDFADGDFFTIATVPISPGGIGYEKMLWLKGNGEVTTSGSDVATWFDETPYNNDFSLAFTGTRPDLTTNGINFNESVEFKATSDVLGLSSFTKLPITTGFTIFAASKSSPKASDQYFFNYNRPSALNFNDLHLTDRTRIWVAHASNGVGTTRDVDVNLPQINGASWTQSSGAMNNFANGSIISSSTITTNTIPSGGTAVLGQEQDGEGLNFTAANAFIGHYGELILHDKTLSATERNKVESYLAVKYSAMLGSTSSPVDYTATDGTTIWTGSTTYQNDIAGIGRDDIEALNQKQSFADGTEDIVTIGLGTIANTNKLNANTFATDKSYFIWGNNNKAMEAVGVTDFDPTMVEGRIARVWKSQETGTVGTLKVRFNLASIKGVNGVPGANDLSNLRLLVDQDGIFAAGATYYSPTTFNNSTDVAEFDVNYTAGTGYYFTLSTTNLSVTPLPITLVSYEAKLSKEGVSLQWTASNHHNSSHFIIERSIDGTKWETVGTVPSSNSSGAKSYSLTDYHYQGETNYYRLIEISTDGERSNYGVRVVEVKANKDFDWKIQPNPNSGRFIINLRDGLEQREYEITFYDMLGNELFKKRISSGSNELDLSFFSSGTYIAKLRTGKSFEIKKIIKL